MINQYKNLKPDGEKCFTYQASKFTWKESGSLGCYLLAKAKSFEATMWLSDGVRTQHTGGSGFISQHQGKNVVFGFMAHI